MARELTGLVIEPTLGRRLLTELSDLNSGFIELLIGINEYQGEREQMALAMPPEQAVQLSRLTRPALRRLSGCAFALFDLRLDDTAFWSSVSSTRTPDQYRGCPAGDASLQRRVMLFTLAALMHLRHLASLNRFMASLSFGIGPSTLDTIADLSLNQLREIADRHPGLLCSRLGTDPVAWSDLIELARRNDCQPLLASKLLGFQHAPTDDQRG